MSYLKAFAFVLVTVSVFVAATSLGYYGLGQGNLPVAIICGAYICLIIVLAIAKLIRYVEEEPR